MAVVSGTNVLRAFVRRGVERRLLRHILLELSGASMKTVHRIRVATNAVALTMGLLVASVIPALSMTVSPLVLEMSTGGPSNKASVRVTNDGPQPLPVEVLVFKLEVGEHGEAKTSPAPNDFIIFPSQTMVQPGASQTVRIQWAGRADIPTSQSYIIAINQVPVKFADTKSGVNMVFNFSIVANVAAPGSSSALTLKNVSIALDEKGVPRPAITVANSGKRHASLGNATLALTGENFDLKISASRLRDMFGVGLVQPGKQRTFLLSVPVPENIRALKGTLDYQAAKADVAQ
jgi:fimbrial chaperone protein